ncbi:MAG: hypothetical protein BroJett039_12710 [Chloroflexota bacterium]|nr:MAG: hypothetical protein BroJett039_12710 [Chloroflexota bacterium]
MNKRIALYVAVVSALFGMMGVAMFFARAAQSQATLQPSSAQTTRAQSIPSTELRVYVLARGGKFVGDDVGGALVTIRDARTKEFLASGLSKGGSGVEDLMTIERARTNPLTIESAAYFSTTLDLSEPRWLEFEAIGPPAAQGSENRVTTTEWVIPQAGTANGNYVILELAGLNVDILEPPTHFLPQHKPPLPMTLRANVTMMCGCPIAPTTAWKPDEIKVTMLVKRPDGKTDTVAFKFDENAPYNAPSQFVAEYTATASGIYEAIVMAHQQKFGNAGSDRITFILP